MAMIGGMYAERSDWTTAEESKEESKDGGLDQFIEQVAYSETDAKYDFCGTDQEVMARVLVQNQVLNNVFETYKSLCSVKKDAGKSVAA